MGKAIAGLLVGAAVMLIVALACLGMADMLNHLIDRIGKTPTILIFLTSVGAIAGLMAVIVPKN